jgi:Flp pilus assembly pilin Flp
MTSTFTKLFRDEAGFIVSAELVLVSTIVVLGMVVGLSEVAANVNQELEDVGSAFGSINQTYKYTGNAGHKGKAVGSQFWDFRDNCDCDCDIQSVAPLAEDNNNDD